MKGIDISNYQPNVDFAKVKAAGYEVIYIKATEGVTYTSPSMLAQYKGAKAQGLKVGFYHYLRGNNPVNEAQHFLNAIGGLANDCVHMIDTEETNGQSNAQTSLNVRQFADYLIGKGQKVGMYTYESFYANNLNSTVKGNLPLWIAHYEVAAPNVSGWVGFQYSSTGAVPGVTGIVDLDIFTNDIFLQTVVPHAPIPYSQKVFEIQGILNQMGIRDRYNLPLVLDGRPGDSTRDALKKILIKRGANNILVAWIQKQLGVGVDGVYGMAPHHETYDAVVAYQKANDLQVDGMIGYDTIRYLLGVTG